MAQRNFEEPPERAEYPEGFIGTYRWNFAIAGHSHRMLKQRIHTTKLPLNKHGTKVMGFVYVFAPVVFGFALMQVTNYVRDRNHENDEVFQAHKRSIEEQGDTRSQNGFQAAESIQRMIAADKKARIDGTKKPAEWDYGCWQEGSGRSVFSPPREAAMAAVTENTEEKIAADRDAEDGSSTGWSLARMWNYTTPAPSGDGDNTNNAVATADGNSSNSNGGVTASQAAADTASKDGKTAWPYK